MMLPVNRTDVGYLQTCPHPHSANFPGCGPNWNAAAPPSIASPSTRTPMSSPHASVTKPAGCELSPKGPAMGRRPSPRCDQCRRTAQQLHPCPCGDSSGCTNPNGICGRCHPIIERNAITRAIIRAYETSTDRIGAGWWQQAACRNQNTALFYADPHDQYSDHARTLCRGCPARWDCLDDALDTNDQFGMRAGLTIKDRRGLRPARSQAEHGTRARYIRGCRCQPCTDANTTYSRQQRRAS